MLKKKTELGKALTKEQMQKVIGGTVIPDDCFPWGDPICCGPCATGGVISHTGSGDVYVGGGVYCYCY
jgi:hypothetical protein